ncbi:hypothetical protein [Anabaena azotica]|uniref:Uncharacterized protein n=1 Tax=Anabaena azotica FACHB-119 TaxID=947527 RepID=A0ABR8DH56_9NOST|nr:hypothetical protein [Anabaena azotica]MBD2505103.1 hypothetical protein [Anabaena azotica FACHB-119]
MSLSEATTTVKSKKNSQYAEILGSPIAFHRVYATIAGSASAGLFLSQAMYWDSRTNDPEGWFYRTYEQWTSETALNRYELDKIRHHLTSINLLETQLKGSPVKLHYRINHQVLNDFFSSIKEGSFTSVRPKNKNVKQHPQISVSVNGQQTESVCSPSTNLSDDGQQSYLSKVNNLHCSPSTNSIYIELENKLEISTQSAFSNLDFSPTLECVCDPTQNDLTPRQNLDQPNPKSPASLSNQPESSPQNENPSSRPSIAVGSFAKSEQANNIDPYKSAKNVEELIDAWTTDPTTFADDPVPLVVREKIKWNCWVLPWHSSQRQLNKRYQNFNPIVVELVARELATAASCPASEKITHAISVMNTWNKTKGGWINLMQRYQQAIQSQVEDTCVPQPKPKFTLAQAIAQDAQRHQQEQSRQKNLPVVQHTPQTLALKAQIEAMAKKKQSKKVRCGLGLSAASVQEIEAQLKQALGA